MFRVFNLTFWDDEEYFKYSGVCAVAILIVFMGAFSFSEWRIFSVGLEMAVLISIDSISFIFESFAHGLPI